jgi:hypothetical protein
MKNLGDAVELGCRVGGCLGILAGNKNVNVAADWVGGTDGLAVWSDSEAWSCSAMMRMAMFVSSFPALTARLLRS